MKTCPCRLVQIILHKPAKRQNRIQLFSRVILSLSRLNYLGNPEPTITWKKNNKQTLKSSEDFLISFDGHLARIEIKDVLRDDEGLYSCVATNPVGEAKTTASLSVRRE